MAKSLSPLLFLYLLAFSCSSLLALGIRHEGEEGKLPIPLRHSGEDRDRGNECRIDKINALEPTSKIKSEAGVTEFWDPNEDQFRCAGVAFMRRFIQPNGLLLPYFRSSPELYYVIKGRGIRGMALPGCKETFQSVSRGESEGRGFRDEHQKILRFRQGDVFALPAGVVQWLFNDGEEDLILVNLIDTNNEINQLDQSFPRGFFLAGNPQREFEEEKGQRGQQGVKNIFDGIDRETLVEVLGVRGEIVERLGSNEDDKRGQIVKAEKLRVIRPPVVRGDESWEERRHGEGERGGRGARGGRGSRGEEWEEIRRGGRGSRGGEEWEEIHRGGRGSRGEEGEEWEEIHGRGRGSRGSRGRGSQGEEGEEWEEIHRGGSRGSRGTRRREGEEQEETHREGRGSRGGEGEEWEEIHRGGSRGGRGSQGERGEGEEREEIHGERRGSRGSRGREGEEWEEIHRRGKGGRGSRGGEGEEWEETRHGGRGGRGSRGGEGEEWEETHHGGRGGRGSQGREGEEWEETRHGGGGRGSREGEEWEETRHGGRGSRGGEEWEEIHRRGGKGGRGSRGEEGEEREEIHYGGRGSERWEEIHRKGSRGSRWGGCSTSDYNLLASVTNELEQPICALKMGASIDDPYRAEIYVPQAGRLTPLTSSNLPVLNLLRMSAERGVLYKNAIMAPHWTLNAHNLIYATRGSARVQIVNERGQDIFHGVLKENQLVVAPQNFVLVKQAGDEGFEWVSFKTNDNSMIQTVAGSTSFIKALPIEVIMNSYRISRKEAEKYERKETLLFTGGSRSSGGGSESERRAIA